MPKKVFFIILVLFLNSFNSLKSEEFLSYCSSTSKKDFIKDTNDCSSEIISLEDIPLADLTEPLHIETGRVEELILPVKNSEQDAFDMDSMRIAAAGTKVTLGIFSPLLTKMEEGGIWVRPYSAFEKIPLKDGPTVKSISYGSLIGIDSDAKDLKNKWQVVSSGYLGYIGSEQSYDSVKQTQMSGFGGIYSTFYRNNFFSAVVLTAGANVIKSTDSEDIIGINAGLITRTGYNIKLPHNIVFQPNYIMTYTFDNNFNYRNNAGELVQEAPLSIIHIVPSARFFTNLKNGWQPFIIMNMNFNIVSNGEVTANNVALPAVSVGPYVEYGGGVQKIWKGEYSTFVQTLVRNGGRNGVSILAGFKWTFN